MCWAVFIVVLGCMWSVGLSWIYLVFCFFWGVEGQNENLLSPREILQHLAAWVIPYPCIKGFAKCRSFFSAVSFLFPWAGDWASLPHISLLWAALLRQATGRCSLTWPWAFQFPEVWLIKLLVLIWKDICIIFLITCSKYARLHFLSWQMKHRATYPWWSVDSGHLGHYEGPGTA